MDTDLLFGLDYPFLDISTLGDVYVNFGALYMPLTYLLTKTQYNYKNKIYSWKLTVNTDNWLQ